MEPKLTRIVESQIRVGTDGDLTGGAAAHVMFLGGCDEEVGVPLEVAEHDFVETIPVLMV